MTTNSGRLELVWPNMAKAACILLVVVMHCGERLSALPSVQDYPFADAWHSINWFLRPMRMPLFFLVSGIMASNSILRPDGRAERNRLTRPLYLYLVWGVIYRIAIPASEGGAWQDMSFVDHAFFVTALMSSSWYMAALGIFYILSRATLKVPLAIVLAACSLLSIMATLISPYFSGNPSNILRCAIFFALGVRRRPQLLAFVDAMTVARTVPLCAAYVVGALACVKLGIFLLPVDVLGVTTGAALCSLAARHLPRLAGPARWLARRTLPIYLIHFLALPFLASVTALWAAPLLGRFWVGFAYPVAAAAALVACSLLAHVVLVRVRAGWLFDLPDRRRAAGVSPGVAAPAEALRIAA